MLNESIEAYKEREILVDKKLREQDRRIHDLEIKNSSLTREIEIFKTVPLGQIAKNQYDTTELIKLVVDNQRLIMGKLEVGEQHGSTS